MRIILALVAMVLAAGSTLATDWLTLPSIYSHDPVSGRRVTQYAPVELPTVPVDTSFRSSGYTHMRSTIRYGQSADNYHQVEKWGDPVRPYGEWQYPYRPYSSPYPNWGAPYGGLNIQPIYGGYPASNGLRRGSSGVLPRPNGPGPNYPGPTNRPR